MANSYYELSCFFCGSGAKAVYRQSRLFPKPESTLLPSRGKFWTSVLPVVLSGEDRSSPGLLDLRQYKAKQLRCGLTIASIKQSDSLLFVGKQQRGVGLIRFLPGM